MVGLVGWLVGDGGEESRERWITVRRRGGGGCGVIWYILWWIDFRFVRAVLWSLFFFRDWGGEDSVDVIETLSLRIFVLLLLCICEVGCGNLVMLLR